MLGAPPVFLFEPHQPEQCNWKPEVILDITPVWEKKRKAFEMHGGAGAPLGVLHARRAAARRAGGAQLRRKKMTYGEAYQRVFPHVTEVLV